ncbi:sugar ABC transporter substrate-binding protein [Nakamurella endophytica]|uniref:sugar ABC transporter substrate-binding protein n=1 Tax=Nakamurella endophytica TaxID=1748367 RepID=UPI001667E7ED|nr:substrate-binding domain-containing protein [Nakamurella endophytica]
MLLPVASDPFAREVAASITRQADLAGAELIVCDPGDNAALLLDCARRLATQHVDGWFARVPADLGDAMCEAGPQQVPLITVGLAPVRCETAAIGADDRQAGELVGTALGVRARQGSGCAGDALLILTDRAEEPASGHRVEGIRAGFAAACPGRTQDDVVLDAGSQESAHRAVAGALASVPDDGDVLVAAVDDGSALGVAAAVPAGREGRVTLAAVGADQRARCAMAADTGWAGDAALFPDRYGEVAVPALLDALHGRPVPGAMVVPSSFVTAATVRALYPADECPAR